MNESRLEMSIDESLATSGRGLTVLMATYNGADTLPRTLNALTQIVRPARGWKLVVVDDGSDDETPEILEEFRARLPLTVIRCNHKGKNAALNAGIVLVEGDLVVFLDDDVLPEPRLLIRYREAADEHLSFGVFGGAVRPAWEVEPPKWVLASVSLGAAWSLNELPEGPCYFTRAFGLNMAIRTEIFRRGYRFNEGIGPDGTGGYGMGSETELEYRLYLDGYLTWFCPNAIVSHLISREQIDEDWVLRRAERFGRGQSAVGYVRVPGRWPLRIGGVPIDLLAMMTGWRIRALFCRLVGLRQKRMQARWRNRYLRGVSHVARQKSSEHEAGESITIGTTRREIIPQTVSIIITNYNYEEFVGAAIASALSQTVPAHEIIVVDDGSTDGSRDVLERFRSESRVHVIFQKNEGQGSAINRGVKASHGEMVILLDADDLLKPAAVATLLANWQPDASQWQFPLELCETDATPIGVHPLSQTAESGNVFWKLVVAGYYHYMPTSGHAFSRRALDKVLPIPSEEWRICADTYLVSTTIAFGPIRSIEEPLAIYRVHGRNAWYKVTIDNSRRRLIRCFQTRTWHYLAEILDSPESLPQEAVAPTKRQCARLYLLRRVVMGCMREPSLYPRSWLRGVIRSGIHASWDAELPLRWRALYLGFFGAAYLGMGRLRRTRRWMFDGCFRPELLRKFVERLKGAEFYEWMRDQTIPASVPKLVFDRNLHFGAAQEAEPYLWYGWDRSLINGAVIVGASAGLVGRVPKNCAGLQVTMDIAPLPAGPVKSQRLDILVNDGAISSENLRQRKKVHFFVPAETMHEVEQIKIEFRSPDFVTPHLVDEQSYDVRPRSFIVHQIRFQRVTSSRADSYPYLPVGKEIEFVDPDSAKYLPTGWAISSSSSTRMLARQSTFQFSILRGAGYDHILTLWFDPDVHRGLKNSNVSVRCGEITLGTIDVTRDSRISVLVPTNMILPSSKNRAYGPAAFEGMVRLTVTADYVLPDQSADGTIGPSVSGPGLRRALLERVSLSVNVPHFVLGNTIEFGNGGSGQRYLASGWQAPDATGVFSCDVRGRIRVLLISDQRDISLTAILGTPNNVGVYLKQELVLVCNGQALAMYNISDRSEITAMIPSELVGPDRLVEIDFCTNIVARPVDLGVGSDDRVLGIKLESLILQ